MDPIALITDFGLTDHFAGSMKAAILGINPRATIIDISHNIPPGDVVAAAGTLLLCFKDFPKNTIFVVVVDPGVGSDRGAIAVKAGGYYFIGPDNGVLSLVCDKIAGATKARKNVMEIRSLENDAYFRKPVSGTFHGRDVFGPAAAHLSKGIAIKKFGPTLGAYLHLPMPEVFVEEKRIIGSVIAMDHFGNCITSIEQDHLEKHLSKDLSITIKGEKPIPVCTCYHDVKQGGPLGILGSSGFLELSINGGSMARKFKLKRGDRVEVTF